MEDKQLIELVRQDDDTAFRTLLKRYEKLIFKNIATLNLEYCDYAIDRQDLYQEACIGLYIACKSYRYDMTCKFSSFAYLVIRRKLLSYLRKVTIPLRQETKSLDKINENYFLKYLLDNSNEKIKNEKEYLVKTIRCVNDFIGTLTDKEKEIINQRMGKKSYSDIAKDLHLNEKTLYYKVHRIKEKFSDFKKQVFNQEEYATAMNI